MIRIAICDDCSDFLQQTEQIISRWDTSVVVATELFEDGDALISAHVRNPFDIILLDVVMPLLNGIETAKELRERDKNVKIVFLTSAAEFAVESYTVKASNYLLKPVNPEKLFACLDELVCACHHVSRSITVKGIHASYRVTLSDIEYVESQGKHIVFSNTSGDTIESLEPLYTFEKTLTLDDGFFKCHRSYIVNIHHINRFSSTEIIMRSGCRIPISRSCQKEFEATYFRVVFGKVGDDV